MMHHQPQLHYGSFPHSPQQKQQYYSELISDFGNCRNRTVQPHQVIVTDWFLNAETNSLASNVSKNKAYNNVSQFDQEGTSTSRDEFQTMKYVKPSIISRDCGKSLQDLVVGMIPNSKISTVGPLGPFTGYATVLKNSRFLKIAQNLLDEFCSKFVTTYDVLETDVASKGSNYSCSSSSMFHSADWGVRSNFGVSMRPDYQQIKAKLMCMQDEVGF
ncbi:BEL1-like homeodomain protein 9-like [Trifolium medium]|uniref:BEL1-like homeodomain protein 9-like n=1 Tax=Trifolium medium TaxID=97028 RepID=A0A392NQK5_9FABA|nr:BEL1-like homeodomain protein 9-like [Trifolium medium]